MHELHLAEDILRKIREEAGTRGLGTGVKCAKIGLGQSRFTHMQELLEIFNDISGGIKLEIEVIPLKAACADCQTEFKPDKMRLNCEKCGSANIQMVSGNELVVKSLG
ncbi:MAG: hydrogenase maturation nickel metallochaperone HypA [Candidatus Margulisbacteria bacterium]|nr:hydrogenase maturation nickel metallochaperone HypA [Candidatus Margulisiibacteriota bacterium]